MQVFDADLRVRLQAVSALKNVVWRLRHKVHAYVRVNMWIYTCVLEQTSTSIPI